MMGPMMDADLVFAKARNSGARIGVGATPKDIEKVRHSVAEAERSGYGQCIIYLEPAALALDLREDRIDAAVRGNMDSNLAMRAVRHEFEVDHLLRMALLQPPSGSLFFFAPVGVDEGQTVTQRLEFAVLGAKLMRRLGLEPSIGVLSGGRKSDRGRSALVDRTLDEAAELVSICQQAGLRAKDCEILIEDAAKECNLIIAPDGISGNLVFRTLHLLCEGRALGAPILNLDAVFVDTSRAKSSYADSIALAAALARMD